VIKAPTGERPDLGRDLFAVEQVSRAVRPTPRTEVAGPEAVGRGSPDGMGLAYARAMDVGRLSLPLAVAGLATLVAASVLIWMLLNEPVALADAIEHGDLTVAVEALGRALVSGLEVLFRYF
jgi:hypothetical protein